MNLKSINLRLPSNRSRLWIGIAAFALLTLFVAYLALQPNAARVNSSTPGDQATDIPIDTSITFELSKPLSLTQQQSVALMSEPELMGRFDFTTDGKTIIFKPNDFLDTGTNYQLTLVGSNLREYPFSFITRERGSLVPLNQLIQQTGPRNPNDPKQALLNSLPYRAEDFIIQYTVVGDNIYVTINTEPISVSKRKALEYLQSFGFDNPEQQLKVRYNIPRTLDPSHLQYIQP